MSQNQPPTNHDQDEPSPLPDTPDYVETVDPATAIPQLRAAVLLIGAMALVMSIMFNWLLYLINNRYEDANARLGQNLSNLAYEHGRYLSAINQIAEVGKEKPALRAVFQRYRVNLPEAKSEPAPPLIPMHDLFPPPDATGPSPNPVPVEPGK